MDHRHSTACCLWATDEEVEQEPEAYDCEICPILAAIDRLDEENAAAWRLYHRVVHRFGSDLSGVTAWAIGRAAEGLDRDEAVDLVERLARIYDALMPAKTGNAEG